MLKSMSHFALVLSLWGGVHAAAPAVPAVQSPLDGAIQLQPNVAFTWTASAGSTYRLQVSLVENFATTVVDDQGFTDAFRNPAGLKNGTHYFWHVLAKNADGSSAYSATRDFTTIIAAPAVTVLAEPANNAVNAALKPLLKWRKLGDAAGYQVQVSTNAAFTGVVVDVPTVVDTVLNVATALDVSKAYFWRVRARNVGGEGPWSLAWSFTTVPAAPAVPTLMVPADNAAQLLLPLTFMWHKADRAVAYTVEISTAADFKTLFFDTTLAKGDTALVYGKKLEYGSTYYWRVRSENPGGNSAFSAPRAVSTLDRPATPLYAKPDADDVDLPVNLGLFWHKTARAVTYRVEWSTSATFATFSFDSTLTDTTKAIGPLDNKTTYYWRVRAKNAAGVSAFTAPRKFTTIILIAPPAPALASPADAATGQSASPTLKWHPSLRAVTYRLQVSLSPTFATTAFDDATLKDTTKAVGPLMNDQTYYWRADAKNEAGVSAWSEIRSFSTKEGAVSEPVLVTPADNAANLPQSLTLVWKPAANAATYRAQISLKADFSTRAADDSDLTDTTLAAVGLTNGETYYWRVRAQNGAGNSEYTAARKFTVIIQAPAACVLVIPADNAMDQKRNLTLKWGAAARAASYRFQLSLTPTFATVAIDDSGLTDTAKALIDLQANTQYFWRARAMNAGGPGAWSEIRSFKTEAGSAVNHGFAGNAQGFKVVSGRSAAQGAELEFSVKSEGQVRFTVINPVNGRSFDLVNKRMEAGTYRVPVGTQGRARGIYFLSMSAGAFRQTQKVFLP